MSHLSDSFVAVLSTELKSRADRLWDAFWSAGISNPSEIIDQATYLMLLRLLDEQYTSQERETARTGKPIEHPIYTEHTQNLRWSRFTREVPQRMLVTIRDEVFPWLHAQADEQFTLFRYMRDARFTIPTPNLLSEVVDLLSSVSLTDGDSGGELFEYMISKLTIAGQNGQFFTPRPIVQLMVEMMAPSLDDEVCDPVSGTGGFLVAVAQYMKAARRQTRKLSEQRKYVDGRTLHGFDFDCTMLRISSMNLLLHGIEHADIRYRDSLTEDMADSFGRYSLVLASPPFAGSLDSGAIAQDLQAIVRTKKTELLFLALSLKLLKPGGRAAIIVPAGLLFGSTNAHKELRYDLVEHNKLDAVVRLPRGSFRPYSEISTAILFFTRKDSEVAEKVWFYDVTANDIGLEPRANSTRSASSGELGHTGSNNFADMLDFWRHRNAMEYSGGHVNSGFSVPKAEIVARNYDLSLNRYRTPGDHTPRAEKWRLGDFSDILGGWVGAKELDNTRKVSDISKKQRVLHPSMLGPTLPDVAELPIRTSPREPKYRLRKGDIVGRDLASARYWTVLPEEYEGVQAGQGLLIIRLVRDVMPAEYLAMYLSSPQAERSFPRYGLIPRIQRRGLKDIDIPACDGDFELVRTAISRLNEGVEEADRIQRMLQQTRAHIFEGVTVDERRVLLERAADQSSLIAQNLRKQNEPYRIFQETYPYGIARAVRKFRQSIAPAEKHEAAIQCAESLILSLGIFCLAFAAYKGREDLSEIDAWTKSVRRGGASLGHWVGVIRAVGADARESGDRAAGLAEATAPQKRGKGLIADLDALVALRNKIRHGAGPRTRAEVERSLATLEKLMHESLSSSAFLARSQWFYMDRLHWLPERGKFQVSGLSLMSDHPDFQPMRLETDRPLADSNLYVLTPGGIIPLSPFCVLNDCPTCLAPELYYPDRLTSSTVQLKSLDRGHELESGSIYKHLAAKVSELSD